MTVLLLYVRHPFGQREPVEVPCDGTVAAITEALAEPREGTLRFQGKDLDPTESLADTGLCAECEVEFVAVVSYTAVLPLQPENVGWWYHGLMFEVEALKSAIRLRAFIFSPKETGTYSYTVHMRPGGYATSPLIAGQEDVPEVAQEGWQTVGPACEIQAVRGTLHKLKLEREATLTIPPGERLGVYIHGNSASAWGLPSVDGTADSWPATFADDWVRVYPGPRTESPVAFSSVDCRAYHLHGAIDLERF
eukprot:TRINITY_DN32706_c0_g1_i1.p1 TRINITY_DN32706_c0_g1~~TRINITY_DN32706_c0_g1_i1.p1  ORF type:complete len:250 (+),score=7.77 TRINITY_DN32706_c0_g1_i1:47-796(+)